MFTRALIAACLAALCGSACAGDVYRWTDDQGRTQFGDSVPERYVRVARKIDTTGAFLTEQDRDAADVRRQRLQDTADAIDARDEALRRRALDAALAAGVDPSAGGGAAIIDDLPKRPEPACRARVRAFVESQRCFDQFRTINGTLLPEAFTQCRNVAPPPPCR